MTPGEPTTNAHSMAHKGLRHRLMLGFGATALAPIVTAIVQLGLVPVFLHFWGAAKYGDWLLLSAIPSYLSLSDLGFGNASGSDMPMRVAANDREGALCTFQSSWLLVTCVSIFTLLVGLISVWRIPWQRLLRLSSLTNDQAAAVIILLGTHVVLCQQWSIAESGFRSDGNFASGTFWTVIQRLVEALAAGTVAVLGGNMLVVASTYLVVRGVGCVGYILRLRHFSPWIRYGIHHARMKTIKELGAPAFGFMALPMGAAISQQGLLLVIGSRLGPISVVSFSTLRTLSRVSYQLIGVVKNGLWPEFSRAFGEANFSLARRLHRYACQATLGLSILGGLMLWVFGPFIYRFWIRGTVGLDAACFHVLLLVVVTTSLWDTSSVVPMSINGHCRIAATYSIAAAFSLVLGWMLVPRFGTTGAAMALLFVDASMTGLVLHTSLRHTRDTMKKFVVALLAVPRFGHTLQSTNYDGVLPSDPVDTVP